MILITGGMGFIGLHTARCLLDTGQSVVLTRFHARREPSFIKDELGHRALVAQLDIADAGAVAALFRRYQISGAIHLAVPALRGVAPADEHCVNIQGLYTILDASRAAGVQRVALASSIAVYAGVAAGPLREDGALRMESGSSTEAFKKAFEVLGLHYAAQTGLDVIALRIAGIYGPLYHTMSNLPSRLTHAAVRGAAPDLAGGRGGVPYADDASDLCYVKDCARGIALLQLAGGLRHRIYNIGAGRATKNRELAAAVNAAVPGAQIELPPGAGPGTRSDAYMDISRIREDVGYAPQYDITSAIADYAAWLRQHAE